MRVRRPKIPEYPDEIRFTTYGKPVPKARATVVRNKKDDPSAGSHGFTPLNTVGWENSICGQSLATKPPYPWQGGIQLGVIFYKHIPKSWSKKKKLACSEGRMRPVGARDDYDNMLKSVKDALNGIYWIDDGQVVDIIDIDGVYSGKRFSDLPRVEILIKFLRDEA